MLYKKNVILFTYMVSLMFFCQFEAIFMATGSIPDNVYSIEKLKTDLEDKQKFALLDIDTNTNS